MIDTCAAPPASASPPTAPPSTVESLNPKQTKPFQSCESDSGNRGGSSTSTSASSAMPVSASSAVLMKQSSSTPSPRPAPLSPSSYTRANSVRSPEATETTSTITSSFKRSPIKVGYLFKQSSGSWKRKRWNQRWFVLDPEMGILKYFRHESLPEAVPFRQDAHGVIHLKEPGASLVIQGDLPRNVPTPFCFTVFDGSRSALICADTNQEFREWTSAISAILSPRKAVVVQTTTATSVPVTTSLSPGSPTGPTTKRAVTESALDRAVALTVVTASTPTGADTRKKDTDIGTNMSASSLSSSASSSSSSSSSSSQSSSPMPEKRSQRAATTTATTTVATATAKAAPAVLDTETVDVPRPSLQQTAVALVVFNALVVVVRYGSDAWLYTSLVVVNTGLAYALWFQKPAIRPVRMTTREYDNLLGSPATATATATTTSTTAHDSEDDEDNDDLHDNAHAPLASACGSPRAGGGGDATSPKSLQPDSPRKATLPRLEKLPSQQTKFLGTVNGGKAKAGASVKMCPPAPAAIVTGCWTQISGTRFQVRQGPSYRKTKLKAPSDESLLELLAIDIYRSPSKIDHIASIIDLGELKPEHSPLDLLIVNCQVPSYQPSNPLWGEKQGNGEGFNFVSYFAISPEIREQLKEHEPGDQAVRLLKNFMQDNSSVRDRFKAIGIVVNPQEQKQLGRTERHLLETYNGQPILTRPQHRFYRGDGYFEVDVDAHEFNYVARKGLAGVSDHFRNMVVDFGFVIEGQEDAELPEQMLGCVRLCKIDVRQALEIA